MNSISSKAKSRDAKWHLDQIVILRKHLHSLTSLYFARYLCIHIAATLFIFILVWLIETGLAVDLLTKTGAVFYLGTFALLTVPAWMINRKICQKLFPGIPSDPSNRNFIFWHLLNYPASDPEAAKNLFDVQRVIKNPMSQSREIAAIDLFIANESERLAIKSGRSKKRPETSSPVELFSRRDLGHHEQNIAPNDALDDKDAAFLVGLRVDVEAAISRLKDIECNQLSKYQVLEPLLHALDELDAVIAGREGRSIPANSEGISS